MAKTFFAALLLSFLCIPVEAQSRVPLRRELKNERQMMRAERREERMQRADDYRQPQPNRQMAQAMAGFFGSNPIEARLWMRILNLQGEQIRRMQMLRRQTSEQYLELERNIRDRRVELDRAIYSEPFNEEEVKRLAAELARLEGERVLMRTRIQAQMRLILTPEQLKTFRELRFGNPAQQSEKPPVEEPQQ